MTWIATVPYAQAGEGLQEALRAQQAAYPPEYRQQVPGLPDKDGEGIVAAHSLIPEALRHAFGTFAACMSPDLPLTRRQHEIIATVVSTANRTRYCSISHREFLRRVTLDDELVRQISTDYRNAPITQAERVMVEYAIQITRDATQIARRDHLRLREVGFDDVGILQITMIAAWFNYINHMADALGVGRDQSDPKARPTAWRRRLCPRQCGSRRSDACGSRIGTAPQVCSQPTLRRTLAATGAGPGPAQVLSRRIPTRPSREPRGRCHFALDRRDSRNHRRQGPLESLPHRGGGDVVQQVMRHELVVAYEHAIQYVAGSEDRQQDA